MWYCKYLEPSDCRKPEVEGTESRMPEGSVVEKESAGNKKWGAFVKKFTKLNLVDQWFQETPAVILMSLARVYHLVGEPACFSTHRLCEKMSLLMMSLCFFFFFYFFFFAAFCTANKMKCWKSHMLWKSHSTESCKKSSNSFRLPNSMRWSSQRFIVSEIESF